MKKGIVAAIFGLTSIVSFGQATSESSAHLTFKGVPIDGPLRGFIGKMEKNGFTLITSKDGVAMLEGEFATYKNCTIGIETAKPKDIVSSITVMFPDQATWPALSTNYFSIKEMLAEKYGTPSDSKEKFEGFEPTTDSERMRLVKFNNCKYYTLYNTDKGTVRLSIEHDETASGFVQLEYRDKANGDLAKSSALDDL